MPFICAVLTGRRHGQCNKRQGHCILRTGPDFLSVLVPLQLNSGVSQIDHQADLSTFVHLVSWIQLLRKSFWQNKTNVTKKLPCLNEVWYLPASKTQIYSPSVFFSSLWVFFSLLSRPLRSVMPYIKAIFSYSSGRAFFRISHTSTSGVSSCCFGSLMVPYTKEQCEGTSHGLVLATCPEELLIILYDREMSNWISETTLYLFLFE